MWESTPAESRLALVEEEPAQFDFNWDSFLAAYAEYLCWHDNLEPPDWVNNSNRFLRQFWYVGGCPPYDRVRTIVTTPGAFEAHGIWFPKEELRVV